ncbi:MAG TPA: thiamine pyrophosphate-dependent enzyme [Nitrolancea sp.]|nr:thiamine pyrophosphate-dependent enzyme [Nitrolancea sp.]
MTKMTGGQALVQSLKRNGLEVIFGLPGVQLDWTFDALYDVQDAIHVYHTRNEQPTSFMADGYARTTGKIGACLVVPGPGVMNALAGLSTAYACSSPVLCIAGEIESEQINVGRGMLHEVPNQLQMMASATKWAHCAMSPGEIPAMVNEAFRQLRSGRPRPVEIEVPPDVLQMTADVMLLDPVTVATAAPDHDLIEQAARALGGAKKPLIYAGGGVMLSGAWEALHELAEMLQAPVVMTPEGKGAISDRSYLAQNIVGGRRLVPESDVILAVGTRFLQPATSPWGPTNEQMVIQLDIDPEEIGRNHAPNIGIVADANLGLRALVDRVAQHNNKRESRKEELVAVQERANDVLFEVQPQASLATAIREELADDDIVISGMTQVGYWSNMGFPVYEPRTFIGAGYQGTLGFEFATALGAQVGNPDKRVVAVIGDGGFLYNISELSTAMRHNINAIMIVFNDGAYGNVRRMQKERFNGRVINSDLLNPDFMKLADSFGMAGMQAHGPDELRTALHSAMKENHPTLIEVPVGEMPSSWGVLRGA